MKKNWEIRKLGDICTYFNDGNWIESKDQSEEGIRLIQTGNIGNGVFQDKDDRARFISDDTFKNLNCTEVFPNDVLISRLPDPIGRACIIPDIGLKMITAVDCTIARFKKDVLNSYFIYYSQSDEYAKRINVFSTGTTRKRISRANLSNIPIPIPPLPVQEAIVKELDILHRLKELQQQQLAEYDNLAQSTFYSMFGDPIENEKGWEVKKLRDVGEIITGSTPKTSDKRNYDSNDHYFAKPSDFEEGVKKLLETEFYISKFAFNNSRKLPVNSVLVTCIGIIGKVAINKVECTTNQQINSIIPNTDVNYEYLGFCLFLYKDFLQQIANAPVVPILNKSNFSMVEIPIPPLSLQTDFANRIEKIEAQKALVKQAIAQTQLLIDYTMDKYFG